jgi:hypothetical protein
MGSPSSRVREKGLGRVSASKDCLTHGCPLDVQRMEAVNPREVSPSVPLCAGGGTNNEAISSAPASKKQASVPIFISNFPFIFSAERGSMVSGWYFG